MSSLGPVRAVDGSIIAARRKQRGWTQEQLGRKVGLPDRSIRRIESKNSARQANIELIAEALGVDVQSLLSESDQDSRHDTDPDDRPLSLDDGTRPLPDSPVASTLLVARHRVVPFIGRTGELADLDDWQSSEDPLALRLIYGPGGAGKTRLAIEWIGRRRRLGERIGFIDTLSEETMKSIVTSDSTTVVLDYAESHEHLGTLLDMAIETRSKGGRLRFLLLARHAGEWWSSIKDRSSSTRALLRDARPLGSLPGAGVTERRQEYERALEQLSQAASKCNLISAPLSPVAETPSFDHPRFERALYLHMAALATVLGLPLFDPEHLLEEILAHESRSWLRRVRLDNEDTRRDFIEHAQQLLAAVTIVGGMDRDSFLELAQDLGVEPERARTLGRLFHDLYRRGPGTIAPLEPDLLGEALVLGVLQARGEPGASRWLQRIAARFDGDGSA